MPISLTDTLPAQKRIPALAKDTFESIGVVGRGCSMAFVRCTLLAVAAAFLVVPTAAADIVTLRFEGTIDQVADALWNDFGIGDPVWFELSWDRAPSSFAPDGSIAQHWLYGMSGVFDDHVASDPYAGPFPSLTVYRNQFTTPLVLQATFDEYLSDGQLNGDHVGSQSQYRPFGFGLSLGYDSAFFEPFVLPAEIPMPNLFAQWNLYYRDCPRACGGPAISGSVTSIARVPEPATLGLLSIGILGVLACSRRARRSVRILK